MMAPGTIVLLVVLLLVVVVVLWIVGMYNGLVRLRNRVQNAWSQIDVQLKRRHDLIPNLVETAKGYMTHERETLEAVTKARNLARQAGSPGEAAKAEGQLSSALGQFFLVVEQVPQPEGQRELPGPPGGADLDGEQDQLRAPVL